MKLHRQNKIIVALIAVLLAVTVGYALFSETLNIKGTAKASGEFNLIFSEVLNNDIVRKGASGIAEIEEPDKNQLSIKNVVLNYPTAYIDIPVKIKNTGSISARLKGIRTEGVNTTDIKVTYSGIAEDEILNPKEEKEMKIKVTWDENSKNIVENLSFNIYLDYEQVQYAQDGSITPTPIENDNFVYEGTKLIGLSAVGEEHYKSNKTLVVPDGTTEISDGAFFIPYGTPSENIPDLSFIANNYFNYVLGVISSEDKVKFEGEFYKAIMLEKNNKANKRLDEITLKLPNTLKNIGKASFGSITIKGDILIPNSVTKIDSFAFGGTFDFSNPEVKIKSKGNLILSNNLNKIGMAAFAFANFTGDLIIPNSVTEIEPAAFTNAGFNGTLTLSNNITTILNDTFSDCGFSGELYIPDNITKIGGNAFAIWQASNNKLTNISISKNTSYESNSFINRPTPTVRN